jgi:hypothetical protein
MKFSEFPIESINVAFHFKDAVVLHDAVDVDIHFDCSHDVSVIPDVLILIF